MKNKLTGILLVLCMLAGLLPGTALAETVVPETENGVYLIDSADELFWFAEKVNGGEKDANAALTADIDLENREWTPIGDGYSYSNSNGNGITADTAYTGLFDGRGHSVSGLHIETRKLKKKDKDKENYDTYCKGLFGIIGEGGTVKNLTVNGKINARADGNEYVKAAKYIGGISGINAGLILNCTNNAEITGHTCVGGISGAVGAQLAGGKRVSGKIINAHNNGNVTATSESSANAGGICGKLAWGEISYAANHGDVKAPFPENNDMFGYASIRLLGGIAGGDINSDGSSVISRCFNDGKIGTSGGNYIAGIIGLKYSCDVTDVYNAGEVNGFGSSGGLVGYMLGGKLENAYNSADVIMHGADGEIKDGNTLIGSLGGGFADNLYSVGSSKMYTADKQAETGSIKSVQTVTAAELSDAFIDTDDLPVIDFSGAPTGTDESFAAADFELENGKITIYLDKILRETNLKIDDFEIKAYVNGKAAALANMQLAQRNETVTVAEISFAPVNAESILKISVDGIEKEIETAATDFWTDYRAENFSGIGDTNEISSAEELALLAYRVNSGEDMTGKYFVLTGDIDLSGKKWTPIGTAEKYLENKYSGTCFNGVFDGKGHEIKGIDVSESGYVSGLFGIADDSAVIKNMTVRGRIENTNAVGYGTAAAVCAVNYGVVSGCTSYAAVLSESYAGGIVGWNGAVNKTVTSAIITECKNEGAVAGKKESGGIAAYSSGTIEKCCNKAEVTASDGYAGGICGYNYEGSVLLGSCYNLGTVSAGTYAGGIAGKAYNSEMRDCYNAGVVLSERAGGILGDTVSGYRVKNSFYVAGTAPMPYAENTGTGFEAKTEAQMSEMAEKLGKDFIKTENLPILTWEINGTTDIDKKPSGGDTDPDKPQTPEDTEKAPEYDSHGKWQDYRADGFESGDGTEENPYVIASGEQLAYFAARVNGGENFAGKYLKLSRNLDITDKLHTPAGTAENTPFAGNFDGNGYEITLNNDENSVVGGLFGYTDGAKISMLGVSGLAKASEIAGGIAAVTKNTSFENCYSNVFAQSDSYAGGFIGAAKSGTSVVNCYASGAAAAEKAGTMFGLFANGVGVNNLFCRIAGNAQPIGENISENTSAVWGKTSEYMQSDNFTDDLWLIREKTVDGKTVAAAPVFLIGEKYPVLSGGYTESKILSLKLKAPGKCLAQGAPHIFDVVIYGKNLAGAQSAAWSCDNDKVTVVPQNSQGSSAEIILSPEIPNGTKITVTVSMDGKSDSATFTAGNAVWAGNGTEQNPYIIASLDDITALADSVNGGNSCRGLYFALSGDLNMDSGESFGSIGYWDGLKSDDNGQWWESENNRPFEGTFDGRGFALKNIVFNAENSYYGLFSYIGRNGTVKNLKIDGTNRFTAHNNVRSVSALCGVNLGKIVNCVNDADYGFTASNVNGLSGICGVNYGIIEECVNSSDMNAAGTGKSGICSVNYGTILKCENRGMLGNAGSIGGIAAENRNGRGQAIRFIDEYKDMPLSGEIKECINNGRIAANGDAGGITADNYSGGLIENCVNTAEISGGMTGGISGRASGCFASGGIKNSKNSGSVIAGGFYGGGICGELINGLVYFCENRGDVSGSSYAGGICGRNYSSTNIGESAVEFCNNFGSVTGKTASGIVGYYQDESGKCRVRYNYNEGAAQYGILGDINSRFDLAQVLADNNMLESSAQSGSKRDGINGISSVTAEELENCKNADVNLFVEKTDLTVNESISVTSDREALSSDSDIITVENGTVTGKNVGTAYVFAKASPYKYAAVPVTVSEDASKIKDISVSFTLIGEKNLGSSFVLDNNTPNTYTVWVAEKTYTVKEGSSVGELLKTVLDENNLSCRGLESGYVSSIKSPDGYWLGEFSNGKFSGWMYTVNGAHPAVGMNDYRLQGGEKVVWHYVDDYRQEVADWNETSGEYAAIGDGSLHNRWLKAAGESGSTDTGDNTRPAGSTSGSGGKTTVPQGEKLPTVSAETKAEFADVEQDAWYSKAVEYVFKNNLMKGISDTEFAPDTPLTRAMFVTVLYRFSGKTASGKAKFSDIPDGAWFADAVAWANENGVVSGISDTEFSPYAEITREQMAAMLYNYAKFIGSAAAESTDMMRYTDFDDVSDYAREAVVYAVACGIITGKTQETINPKDNATRAETAMIIMRFAEMKK